LGVVPAATHTARAGMTVAPPSARANLSAATAPYPSATASVGETFSMKLIPSSSALATSS
jgi:hypothetical protein